MIKTDYHTHSNYSSDGKASMNTMIEHAIKLGLEEYAITDHLDFAWPAGKIIGPHDIADMVKAIQIAKEKYAHSIKVLVGVELSIRPDLEEIAQQMADAYDFDIIIGSPHDIKGIDFYFPELYQNYPKHEAYMIYFENLLDVVRNCSTYDVVGHLDYVERYGKYPDKTLYYSDYREIIDEILSTIISKGKGIEINTSGITYGLGHPHPQTDILRRYVQLGGEIITVGSDAHAPKNIAQHFDVAYEILQQLGVKYITRFDKRKPKFVKI